MHSFSATRVRHFACSLLAAVAGVTACSSATADQALATSKNCMVCHSVDTKLVGPSFKDVAAKYAKRKDSLDALTAKVLKGGAGVWGAIPMPPNTQVTNDEARQLVAWVLAQK